MRIVGTAIIIYDDISEQRLSYIVTAKHVLEGINGKGLNEIFVRVNLNDGTSRWYATDFADWKLNQDKDVDIGIYQAVGDASWDHISYKLSASLSDKLIQENEIDIGDEVFVIGLFTHHHGQRRNIPIARIGNISAMNEGKIQTSRHLMDAYLIEARSIGGLSGSPVFINLGEVRYLQGGLKHSIGGRAFLLMGLIYGHFDVKSTQIDEAKDDVNAGSRIENINTGVAIVTPVEKIIETIRQARSKNDH